MDLIGTACSRGYPEAESGLSKIALDWMLREAVSAGLLVDDVRVSDVLGQSDAKYSKPDPKAELHESLTPPWWICEFTPKRHWDWKKGRESHRMNLFRRRTIPPGAMVHKATFERGPAYAARLPSDAIKVS